MVVVKSLFVFISIALLMVVSFLLVGFCAPVENTTELSQQFNCSSQLLWSELTDISSYPEFKEDLQRVEIIDNQGERGWIEYDKLGAKTHVVILEERPGKELKVKLFYPGSDIERVRTYAIFGDSENSVLSISESSRIKPLLLRSTMAISGRDLGLKKEVQSLRQHLNS